VIVSGSHLRTVSAISADTWWPWARDLLDDLAPHPDIELFLHRAIAQQRQADVADARLQLAADRRGGQRGVGEHAIAHFVPDDPQVRP
jgi:hypothetical protein